MTVVVLCALSFCGHPHGGHAATIPPRGGPAREVVVPVPHLQQWVCIHGHEAAWNDSGDPYWGGLQMDRNFMEAYGRDMLQRHHGQLADAWTPREQMVVAERAYRTRGYTPWPNTARMCGYL